MTKTLGRMTDRLLAVLVPRTTAGACPCGDSYCTAYYCQKGSGQVTTCRDSCDCTSWKCTPCRTGSC